MSQQPASRVSPERYGSQRQDERAAATRRRLVDAALECINQTGYARASTAAIARRAGVSRGALQHHFRSRTELMAEVLLQVGERMRARTRSAEAATRPAAARIARYVDETWAVFRSDAFRAALQIWLDVPGEPALHALVIERMAHYERLREREWHRMVQRGSLSLGSARTARNLTIGTLRGLAFRTLFWRRGTEPRAEIALLKEMLIARLAGPAEGERRRALSAAEDAPTARSNRRRPIVRRR